jgi:hypothetical protein
VNNVTSYTFAKTSSWSEAWQNRLFRKKLITGVILFISLLLILPTFFAFIEKREGIVLNDWLLNILPARDFSVLIFIIIWSSCVLVIIRSVQSPAFFLQVLLSGVALLLIRIGTIYFVPLEPPEGLIKLADPLTSLTYGGRGIFITKDLFFSGHTSDLFLIYLCLEKKGDKLFVLLATITVGILVLVQHVHYSIDVIGAIFITYFLVMAVKKLAKPTLTSSGLEE